MKQEELERLWDKVRDGEATAAERRAFDEHMLDDPEMAALWGAETRWLESLKHTALPAQQPGELSFTQQVLDEYEQLQSRRLFTRMDWQTARFAAGWAIAAVTLAVIMWVNQPENNMSGGGTELASQPVPQRFEPDPVSVLVGDMTEQYQVQPANVYNTVRDTHSMLSVRQAFNLLGMEPPKRRGHERD